MAGRGWGWAQQPVPGPVVPDGTDEPAPAAPGSASQPQPVPTLGPRDAAHHLLTPGDVWQGGQIRAAGEDDDDDVAGDPGGDHKQEHYGAESQTRQAVRMDEN